MHCLFLVSENIGTFAMSKKPGFVAGSCGKVPGTNDLVVCLVSQIRNSGAGQRAGTRAPFPCISQDREFLMVIIHCFFGGRVLGPRANASAECFFCISLP